MIFKCYTCDAMARLAASLICFAALALTGCASQARQTGTIQRVEERVGIEHGQPTQLSVTTTERSTSDMQASAGVDVGKAVAAAMAGLKGDLVSAIHALKPADPSPSGGIDLGTSGAIGTAATLGALALREWIGRRQERAEKERARAEVDEEYRRANDAQRRAEEYARHLPPPAVPTPNVQSQS